MQDNMRLTLPASGPEPKGAPAEVRVMLWDDGLEGGRGRCYVSLYAEPGKPLVIRPADYVSKAKMRLKLRGDWMVDFALKAGQLMEIDPEDYQKQHDAPKPEDERVMVRAVSPSHPAPDDDGYTWALDPSATGHRAPFAAGDLVVEASGYSGIHQVVAVSMDDDAEAHRKLRLTVKRAWPVVDKDAF